MLTEDQVSSCIDALVRLGALDKVAVEDGGGEQLRLKVLPERIVSRIAGGEFGAPPEGAELTPWLSCIILKTLLEERDVGVSKEEFTAMAAVLTGFLSEAALEPVARPDSGRPVISHRRRRQSK